MKIVCVCGFGLGTSVMAKSNLEKILTENNIQAEVDAIDIGSINSAPADYYITTKNLANNIPLNLQDRTIVLTNIVSKREMLEAVSEIENLMEK
ncbi:PTS maltose transporter subunit IIABC [Suicoccus acidiformans]|uniref:PTS maltose transporter subunit IIABC n=1 Tax=Suicoccus acidiformans TaxID=2036206 RepID=A0A347WIU4_9LACT|nr:PTS sugar transporter subunit IIB [Suicoccus acidiformans]AXY25001.1 PTS maltose transporter subunit IIABC [Suicoccus acidiformans]